MSHNKQVKKEALRAPITKGVMCPETMNIVQTYFARKRIRAFLESMHIKLARDYGGSKEYTEGQVRTALLSLKYGKDFEDVAISIFCNEEVAEVLNLDKERFNYLRREIGNYQNSVGTGGEPIDAGGADGD